MSSRHALGEGSAHQFSIVIKTITGKSYEITEMEGWFYVEVLKTILMYKIDPPPGVGRMRLIFEKNMLDDLKRLSEYIICEGSELDLVLLTPPSKSRSRASRERSRRRGRSWRVREGLMRLDRCREI